MSDPGAIDHEFVDRCCQPYSECDPFRGPFGVDVRVLGDEA